jgi:hypothetical protein
VKPERRAAARALADSLSAGVAGRLVVEERHGADALALSPELDG